MLSKTTYDQFVSAGRRATRVVVYQEIYGDLLTPTQAFQNLRQGASKAAILEFSPRTAKPYSFIGLDPIAEFSALGHDICIELEGQRETRTDDPFNALRILRDKIDCLDTNSLLALTGGAVGYMSYDAIRLIENIPDRHPNEDNIPDISLTFYGSSITFDPKTSKVIVAKVITIENDLKSCFKKGMNAINEMIQQLKNHSPAQSSINAINDDENFEADLSDEAYGEIVKKAKTYITKGDIFQVVPSRTFTKKYNGDTFAIYRALKKISPSPYHFYIQNNDITIVGASPEKIVSLHNHIIESTPLAGTRPRNIEIEVDDETVAEELMNDHKEIAEHMMLVDLARNDVGAVSKAGTVKVTEQPHTVNFSHVMHIASTVQGAIAEKFDALDVLKATFPAGTLSGAPKIRAMEIIDELENSRRGVYGGAIVALDREDNLDTCIAIRTAVIKNGVAKIRAGGGVVYDSNPTAEAQETRHKARSIMTAIKTAEGGML